MSVRRSAQEGIQVVLLGTESVSAGARSCTGQQHRVGKWLRQVGVLVLLLLVVGVLCGADHRACIVQGIYRSVQ